MSLLVERYLIFIFLQKLLRWIAYTAAKSSFEAHARKNCIVLLHSLCIDDSEIKSFMQDWTGLFGEKTEMFIIVKGEIQ